MLHTDRLKALQCTALAPVETEEEPGPEAPYRAQNFHLVQTVPSVRQPEKRIRWPKACKITEWQWFNDADKVLEATAKWDVERKLLTVMTIIVCMAAELS